MDPSTTTTPAASQQSDNDHETALSVSSSSKTTSKMTSISTIADLHTAFGYNVSNDPNADENSAEYMAHLNLALEADLEEIGWSGCVTEGVDDHGVPVIICIPRLAFDKKTVTQAQLQSMLHLLVKRADKVIRSPFSIVYAHDGAQYWINRLPIVFRFYKLLPQAYKRNLLNTYIIHPNLRIKTIFELSRFLSKTFYEKLCYVDNVVEFQRIISPLHCNLPYPYLVIEDEEQAVTACGTTASLIESFDEKLGTTKLIANCVRFLRSQGLNSHGIFRISGDNNLLSLVKTRMQPGWTQDKNAYLDCIVVGDLSYQQALGEEGLAVIATAGRGLPSGRGAGGGSSLTSGSIDDMDGDADSNSPRRVYGATYGLSAEDKKAAAAAVASSTRPSSLSIFKMPWGQGGVGGGDGVQRERRGSEGMGDGEGSDAGGLGPGAGARLGVGAGMGTSMRPMGPGTGLGRKAGAGAAGSAAPGTVLGRVQSMSKAAFHSAVTAASNLGHGSSHGSSHGKGGGGGISTGSGGPGESPGRPVRRDSGRVGSGRFPFPAEVASLMATMFGGGGGRSGTGSEDQSVISGTDRDAASEVSDEDGGGGGSAGSWAGAGVGAGVVMSADEAREKVPLSVVVLRDVDTVAQTLKMMLRELPEPVITFAAYDSLMRLCQEHQSGRMEEKDWGREVDSTIDGMPTAHRETLKFLLSFLRDVAACSEQNSMDLSNLSKVFSPTLMRPAVEVGLESAFAEILRCQQVLIRLLTTYGLAEPLPIPPTAPPSSSSSSARASASDSPSGSRSLSPVPPSRSPPRMAHVSPAAAAGAAEQSSGMTPPPPRSSSSSSSSSPSSSSPSPTPQNTMTPLPPRSSSQSSSSSSSSSNAPAPTPAAAPPHADPFAASSATASMKSSLMAGLKPLPPSNRASRHVAAPRPAVSSPAPHPDHTHHPEHSEPSMSTPMALSWIATSQTDAAAGTTHWTPTHDSSSLAASPGALAVDPGEFSAVGAALPTLARAASPGKRSGAVAPVGGMAVEIIPDTGSSGARGGERVFERVLERGQEGGSDKDSPSKRSDKDFAHSSTSYFSPSSASSSSSAEGKILPITESNLRAHKGSIFSLSSTAGNAGNPLSYLLGYLMGQGGSTGGSSHGSLSGSGQQSSPRTGESNPGSARKDPSMLPAVVGHSPQELRLLSPSLAAGGGSHAGAGAGHKGSTAMAVSEEDALAAAVRQNALRVRNRRRKTKEQRDTDDPDAFTRPNSIRSWNDVLDLTTDDVFLDHDSDVDEGVRGVERDRTSPERAGRSPDRARAGK